MKRPFSGITLSSLLLRNGTASLKNLYPLTKVQTEADKKALATKGYHRLDDKVADPHLTDSRIRLLYQILKDADVLDRVRFGIAELDVNYLRLPISHKPVPLAVSAVHGIEM